MSKTKINCLQCQKSVGSRNMPAHLLICSGDNKRRTEVCPKCEKSISLSNIKRHIETCVCNNLKTTRERTIKGLPSTISYIRHIIPTQDKLWQCDQCNKEFKSQKSLAHHYWQCHITLPHETQKRHSNQFISGKQSSHSLDTRSKISQNNILNPRGVALDPSLRSYAGRSKHFEVIDSYNNPVVLQSSWEYELMQNLNRNNISWKRGMTFWLTLKAKTGRSCSYTPDFWLPDYDIYLDPKARENKEQTVRIDYWQKQYQKKLLIIKRKSELTWSFVQSQIPLL